VVLPGATTVYVGGQNAVDVTGTPLPQLDRLGQDSEDLLAGRIQNPCQFESVTGRMILLDDAGRPLIPGSGGGIVIIPESALADLWQKVSREDQMISLTPGSPSRPT
jgi:hypothetical protein